MIYRCILESLGAQQWCLCSHGTPSISVVHTALRLDSSIQGRHCLLKSVQTNLLVQFDSEFVALY